VYVNYALLVRGDDLGLPKHSAALSTTCTVYQTAKSVLETGVLTGMRWSETMHNTHKQTGELCKLCGRRKELPALTDQRFKGRPMALVLAAWPLPHPCRSSSSTVYSLACQPPSRPSISSIPTRSDSICPCPRFRCGSVAAPNLGYGSVVQHCSRYEANILVTECDGVLCCAVFALYRRA